MLGTGWMGEDGAGAAVRHTGACKPLARCCCCNSLRFGALVAAWLNLSVAVATIVVTVEGTRHRIATPASALFFLGNIGAQAGSLACTGAATGRAVGTSSSRYSWSSGFRWMRLGTAWQSGTT